MLNARIVADVAHWPESAVRAEDEKSRRLALSIDIDRNRVSSGKHTDFGAGGVVHGDVDENGRVDIVALRPHD